MNQKTNPKPLHLFARAACFIFVFFVLLWLSSYIFVPSLSGGKNSGVKNYMALGYLGEPKGTLDVVAVGNSDLYSGVSPMEMWNSYGITSYVSSEPRQRMVQAYNILSDVLKLQNPKLVILESDSVFSDNKDATGLGATALEIVKQHFPTLAYHDRWKHFKISSYFTKKPAWRNESKGYNYSGEVRPYKGAEYMIPSNDVLEIDASNLFYMNKIVQLCKEKGIPLLFIEVPSANSWNYAKHNTMVKYARENGANFVDFNLLLNEIGLDWKMDTRDKGNHLNFSGAKKVSHFLGDYLIKTYALTDHRKDPKYDSWHIDYNKYTKVTTPKPINP